MSTSAEERLRELLVDQATEGLAREAELELSALLEEHPAEESERIELAAAALELAFTREEAMPTTLLDNLRVQAAAFNAGRESSSEAMRADGIGSLDSRVVPMHQAKPELQEMAAVERGSGAGSRLGWLLAAAALVLALFGWLPRFLGLDEAGTVEVVALPTSAAPSSVDERFQRLLAEDPEALRLDWSRTDDPTAAQASGEVLWSASRQEGYMVFDGLEVNDPELFQYQLWIFDRTRDERFPVDGGVFDIESGSRAVIAIDPRLQVEEAYLFAITVEPPGGVVVSSRERLPLLAQV